MSTPDVPGANPANKDILTIGCWAENDDGSLIFVEGLEAGTVVYSIFDVPEPKVEYRDAMSEKGFKEQFSWKPGDGDTKDKWTWHDKTPFPWDRIMGDFPAGQRSSSANKVMTAAQRVAEKLDLRAEKIRERHDAAPTFQEAATNLMNAVTNKIKGLKP